MKFDEMKNYGVNDAKLRIDSEKENFIFEARAQETYENNVAQYLFVDPSFLDLINGDFNRYYEHEIYYDCQSNYPDDEPMYCQNLYKHQPLRMSDVFNEIVRPKQFKKVLKQLSLNTSTLYRSFRQAYRKAKKTRKRPRKTPPLKCKCLKCGEEKSRGDFLLQMNQDDMNPWDINSVELPPYNQAGNIGDGDSVGKNKTMAGQKDVDTYCMWFNQQSNRKYCPSWESHSVKSANFPLEDNQTRDNWSPQTPSCSKEIQMCFETDILQNEMPRSKSIQQESPQLATYSCTAVTSTETINETTANEVGKIKPICLMIPLNIKIDSQEGHLHSSNFEFMTETPNAKQNQFNQFIEHESPMERATLPEKPTTLPETIDRFDLPQTPIPKKKEFATKGIAAEIQTYNINTQPQEAMQIEPRPIAPKPMDPIPTTFDLLTSAESIRLKVVSDQEIKQQLTKANQAAKLPASTAEQSSASKPFRIDSLTHVQSSEMKTYSGQQSIERNETGDATETINPPFSVRESHDFQTNPEKLGQVVKYSEMRNENLRSDSLHENRATKVQFQSVHEPGHTPEDKMKFMHKSLPLPTIYETESQLFDRHYYDLVDDEETSQTSRRSAPESVQTNIATAQRKAKGVEKQLVSGSKEMVPPKATESSKQTVAESVQTNISTKQRKAMDVEKQQVLGYKDMIPSKVTESSKQTVAESIQTNISTKPHKAMGVEKQQVSASKEMIPPKATETSKKSVAESVQTDISIVQYKAMGMEKQQFSSSKEMLSPKQSVAESVQTDISTLNHYKRKQIRTEIQHDLEELLQPSLSVSRQLYSSDERDEILLDLNRLFHPEKSLISPDDLSRQNALRDLNYIVKSVSNTGSTTTNAILPESQHSILSGLRHMINPQTEPVEKSKRRKYHKRTKEKILQDFQMFLQPVKEKPSAGKTLRDSVLPDLRYMLDLGGEDKSVAKRSRHSISTNSSHMQQQQSKPLEVIRECIITDCRYLPNSPSHLEKEIVDDLEITAQIYQRHLCLQNYSGLVAQSPFSMNKN